MLSVLFGESGDNLAHLVRFYAPTATRLLDVTYGAGTLPRRSPIPVVGVDKDPTSRAPVLADAGRLPFAPGSFAVACYDPPYLYGSKAMHGGPVGQKTWQPQRSTWKTPNDLIAMSAAVASELACILRPAGVVIVKIMDSRFKGRLIRNHDIVSAAFESNEFVLLDQLVYLRTSIGSFVNLRSAQSAHGYFLIFRK